MPFQPRDFSFKGQVPQEAIMQAYQNKAKQEYQMKMQAEQAKRQKTQETLGIIQQASGLVQQGVQMSNARMQKQARDAYAAMLGDPNATIDQQREAHTKAYPKAAGMLSGKSLYETPKTPEELEGERLKREKDQVIMDRLKRKGGGADASSLINAQAAQNNKALAKKAQFYESLDYDPQAYRNDKGLTLKGKAEVQSLTHLLKNKVRIEKRRAAITGAEFTAAKLETMLHEVAPEGLLDAKEKKSIFSKLKRVFHIAPAPAIEENPDSWMDNYLADELK